jgi:hypothetical protein
MLPILKKVIEMVSPLRKRMKGHFTLTVLSTQTTNTYFDALYFIEVVTAQTVVMTTGAPQPISV